MPAVPWPATGVASDLTMAMRHWHECVMVVGQSARGVSVHVSAAELC
jgi:hypothetical protein